MGSSVLTSKFPLPKLWCTKNSCPNVCGEVTIPHAWSKQITSRFRPPFAQLCWRCPVLSAVFWCVSFLIGVYVKCFFTRVDFKFFLRDCSNSVKPQRDAVKLKFTWARSWNPNWYYSGKTPVDFRESFHALEHKVWAHMFLRNFFLPVMPEIIKE